MCLLLCVRFHATRATADSNIMLCNNGTNPNCYFLRWARYLCLSFFPDVNLIDEWTRANLFSMFPEFVARCSASDAEVELCQNVVLFCNDSLLPEAIVCNLQEDQYDNCEGSSPSNTCYGKIQKWSEGDIKLTTVSNSCEHQLHIRA